MFFRTSTTLFKSCSNIFTTSSRRLISSDPYITVDIPNKVIYADINGKRASLGFRKDGNKVEIHHTQVPAEFKGRGLGKLLVQEAFDYVKKNDLKMTIHCSFVQNYLDYHANPEFKKYLDK